MPAQHSQPTLRFSLPSSLSAEPTDIRMILDFFLQFYELTKYKKVSWEFTDKFTEITNLESFIQLYFLFCPVSLCKWSSE